MRLRVASVESTRCPADDSLPRVELLLGHAVLGDLDRTRLLMRSTTVLGVGGVRADVDGELAGVLMERRVRLDRVRQAALLADLLEEPR